MRAKRNCTVFALVCTLLPASGLRAEGQETAPFSTEQLEQMVAPIALYPDPLLTQLLMASTYPLEIVEADRWMAKNKSLSGSALDEALKEQEWDASVKSLCHVPDVLTKMSENLDWTQDLGDAFLAQEQELMDTVQTMRGKARDAGNLKSSDQQVVTQQPDKIIVIESPSPEVIYVPTYSPTVVYGPAWTYPVYYYPPLYYPPPPGYGLVTFGVGMAVGAAIWGDCHWGWGSSDVDIDIDRYNNFNRNTNVNADRSRISQGGAGNRANWQHDPSHRKGVNYPNQDVARKYGAPEGASRVSRDQARGWSGQRGTSGARTGSAQARDRASAGTGARAPGAGRADRAQVTSRAGASAGRRDGSVGRVGSGDTALSGSRNARFDRAASSRGSMSRGTTSFGGGGRRVSGGRRR